MMDSSSGWKIAEKDGSLIQVSGLPFDVITNSMPNSYDALKFEFYGIGWITLEMKEGEFIAMYRMKYDCTPDTKKTARLPDALVKVWTFSKTSSSVLIHCNGQIAANISFDEGVTHCERRWSRNVDKIRFIGYGGDAASDYYRVKQASGTGVTLLIKKTYFDRYKN